MKYFVIFLITGFIYDPPTKANENIPKIGNVKTENGIMHLLIVNFFQTCNHNHEKVLIFDDVHTQNTFRALTDIQPRISVSLFTNITAWNQLRRNQFDDLRVDVVIITININDGWNMLKKYFMDWRFNRDCIVYVFPAPLNDCVSYKLILELIMRFYFPVVYYICLMDDKVTQVYTHDPYGDTEPPYWGKISQGLLWGKNWTFYERGYANDMSELCPGFYFRRTDPTNKIYVVSLLSKTNSYDHKIGKENMFYSDRIENDLYPPCRRIVNDLKSLLKIQFKYYTLKGFEKDSSQRESYEGSSIDVAIFDKVVMKSRFWRNYFYPIIYDTYIILSHNRGFMTPLEKISKYYGMWTLLSLIIILSITFVVIWRRTKKPWLAAFDVVRLLINTGIFVPINTHPLQIFFSVIFLYFLVIHATFSGRLAEFLTKAQHRSNIETIDDLKDSRIEKIYVFEHEYDEGKELDVLRLKSEEILASDRCTAILHQPNSVCIAPFATSRDIQLRYINSSLHISKHKFGNLLVGFSVRPGFPLYEKFNWAFTYLFDTAIIYREWKQRRNLISEIMKSRIESTHVDWRKITLGDLYFSFVLLIAGYCVGFICFLFELNWKNMFRLFNNRHHLKHNKPLRIVVHPK